MSLEPKKIFPRRTKFKAAAGLEIGRERTKRGGDK